MITRRGLAAVLLTISVSIGNFVLNQVWTVISGDEDWTIWGWGLAIGIVLVAVGFTTKSAMALTDINSNSGN